MSHASSSQGDGLFAEGSMYQISKPLHSQLHLTLGALDEEELQAVEAVRKRRHDEQWKLNPDFCAQGRA